MSNPTTLCVLIFSAAVSCLLSGCSQDDEAAEDPLPMLSDRARRAIDEIQRPLGRKVSADKLGKHIDFLASEPRSQGTTNLEASRDYCASQLEAFGFDVQRLSVDGTDVVNVVGERRGSLNPDRKVVLSAHIDSVPDCNGADDNATGVAGVLEAARVLAQRDHSNTLVVACWDGEEQGLAGSLRFAAEQRETGAELRAVFVLEMIGFTSSAPNSQRLPVSAEDEQLFSLIFPETYDDFVAHDRRGDFIALVYDVPGAISPAGASSAADAFVSATLEAPVRTSRLPLTAAFIDQFPDTTRSDHAAFWKQGFSALMITDTANLRNPNYHCRGGADARDTIDVSFVTRVTRATVGAVVHELER